MRVYFLFRFREPLFFRLQEPLKTAFPILFRTGMAAVAPPCRPGGLCLRRFLLPESGSCRSGQKGRRA